MAFFSFPSRSRIEGMGFFNSLPVPELWEWNYPFPFPFLNSQMSFPLNPDWNNVPLTKDLLQGQQVVALMYHWKVPSFFSCPGHWIWYQSKKVCQQSCLSAHQAPAGSRIFNPGISGTGFCKIPGFFGMGLAWNFYPGILPKHCQRHNGPKGCFQQNNCF